MLDSLTWSNPSTYGTGTGVHHGYSAAPADLTDIGHIAAGGTISNAWYAKLDPGGFIVPHVDQGPWMERWHYPISGSYHILQEWNPDDEEGDPHFRFLTMRISSVAGAPYRMHHHQPHAVWNPYDEPRIILIVEYDNPVNQPTTDLILCDMIPEVQSMIDAL